MALIIHTSKAEVKLDSLLSERVGLIARLTLTEPPIGHEIGATISANLDPTSARLLRDALDALLRRA